MDLSGLLEFVKQFGLPMGMFLALFIYTMKESKARESKLMETLNKFASCFEGLKQDIAEIKSDVEDLKNK